MTIELSEDEAEIISQALYSAVFHNPMRYQRVQEAFAAKVREVKPVSPTSDIKPVEHNPDNDFSCKGHV